VYTIVEKPGDKSFWLRVGTGWLNRDGSWNLKLDALPVNGVLQMRDMPARDEREGFRATEREARDPALGRAIA
jgi:hypothetical protein